MHKIHKNLKTGGGQTQGQQQSHTPLEILPSLFYQYGNWWYRNWELPPTFDQARTLWRSLKKKSLVILAKNIYFL